MNKSLIQLLPPSSVFKDSFLAGLKEFQDEKLPWALPNNCDELRDNFEEFVQRQLAKYTTWTKDKPVKESIFWAILGSEYVGTVSIRHSLNEDLRMMGGHIGYDTRPSFRRRGIASEMLKLALPLAKQIGISEALLTCNDSNIPSIKVIEKNGGRLVDTKPQYEGGPLKRYYWITL